MVMFNKNKKPSNWDNYKNCIQPNNLRNYDGYNNFRLKYPLATIHFLIGILGSEIKFKIPRSAICPLFYVNGVFKNLFSYPENSIDWLRYLNADKHKNKLHDIFLNKHYSVYNLMIALKDFFVRIGDISEKQVGNDKIKISNSKGEPVNIRKMSNVFEIEQTEKIKAESFLKILAKLTGWDYENKNWQWSNFQIYSFSKNCLKPTNKNFEAMIKKNPITWAMTSGLAIEYTLDEKNLLLK